MNSQFSENDLAAIFVELKEHMGDAITEVYGLRAPEPASDHPTVRSFHNNSALASSARREEGHDLWVQMSEATDNPANGDRRSRGMMETMAVIGGAVTTAGVVITQFKTIFDSMKKNVTEVKEIGGGLKDTCKFFKKLFERTSPEDKQIKALEEKIQKMEAQQQKLDKIKELEERLNKLQGAKPDEETAKQVRETMSMADEDDLPDDLVNALQSVKPEHQEAMRAQLLEVINGFDQKLFPTPETGSQPAPQFAYQ